MPGFGFGPLGHNPFGKWAWARQVLWDFIPENYRAADVDNGGLLQAFAEGLMPSFDALKDKIRRYLELRLPYDVRVRDQDFRVLTLGKQIVPRGDVLQRGVTGKVDAIFQFTAPTGRFTAGDVGRILVISGSIFAANNQEVTVTGVVAASTLLTFPNLNPDGGPLVWELKEKVDLPVNQVTVEVRAGDVEGVNPGWILKDGFGEYVVMARRRFDQNGIPLSAVSQSGQRLTAVYGDSPVVTVNGTFTVEDVGKPFELSGSRTTGNNGIYRVRAVPGGTGSSLQLDGTLVTDPDEDTLTWALLKNPSYAQLDLQSVAPPKSIVEQEGQGLVLTALSSTEIQVTPILLGSCSFNPTDVGKLFIISGSNVPENNLVATIESVQSQVEITILTAPGAITLPDDSLVKVRWEVRQVASILPNAVQVMVSAPPLLDLLAQDFALSVDSQEDVNRQRSYVRNVSAWVDDKGTANAYRILGAISGFAVQISQLYRISQDMFDATPSDSQHEIGDVDPGKRGTDGYLFSSPFGRVRFSSPTASFGGRDLGRVVKIQGAANSFNNKYFTIDALVNSQTVDFRLDDLAVLPEGASGHLTWGVVRLYSDLPPARPVYDEFNSDLFTELVNGLPEVQDAFGVDRFCWQADFVPEVRFRIVGSNPKSPGVFTILAQDTAQPVSLMVGGVGVISGAPGAVWDGIGSWNIQDSAGNVFSLLTVPDPGVLPPGQYQFDVSSVVQPQADAGNDAILTYVCAVTPSCGYCPSYRLLGLIEVGLPASVVI